MIRILYSTVVPALAFLFVPLSSTLAQSAAGSTVSSELACEHLFLNVAGGPGSPPYSARVNMLGRSGLTLADSWTIIRSANAYLAAVALFSAQAKAIHQSLRSKAIAQADAVQQLQTLDRQRQKAVAQAFEQLKFDLGSSGSVILEAFLNNHVKTTIIVGQ